MLIEDGLPPLQELHVRRLKPSPYGSRLLLCRYAMIITPKESLITG